MQLLTVSIGDVEDDLVAFFVRHYGTPTTALTPATNLRTLYGFSGNAWIQLGDVISDLPWMRRLGVRLSPQDMMAVSTLGQLAYRIVSKMRQVVAIASYTALASVKTLMTEGAAATVVVPRAATHKKKPSNARAKKKVKRRVKTVK